MPYYIVEAYADDCQVSARHWSAKRAFADAVEWRIVRLLSNVTIDDGSMRYSIAEFAAHIAQQEAAENSRRVVNIGPAGDGGILRVQHIGASGKRDDVPQSSF